MSVFFIKPGTIDEVRAQMGGIARPGDTLMFEPGEYSCWPSEGLQLPPGFTIVLLPGTFIFKGALVKKSSEDP